MCIFHPFRFGGRSTGVGQSNQVVLVICLRLETVPAMVALFSVVSQTFQNCLIELPTQLAFGSVGICVDDQGNVGVPFSIAVKERQELGVDDDYIRICMVKDVRDVLMLQAVVDG